MNDFAFYAFVVAPMMMLLSGLALYAVGSWALKKPSN
jgi:hypothetical protein